MTSGMGFFNLDDCLGFHLCSSAFKASTSRPSSAASLRAKLSSSSIVTLDEDARIGFPDGDGDEFVFGVFLKYASRLTLLPSCWTFRFFDGDALDACTRLGGMRRKLEVLTIRLSSLAENILKILQKINSVEETRVCMCCLDLETKHPSRLRRGKMFSVTVRKNSAANGSYFVRRLKQRLSQSIQSPISSS